MMFTCWSSYTWYLGWHMMCVHIFYPFGRLFVFWLLSFIFKLSYKVMDFIMVFHIYAIMLCYYSDPLTYSGQEAFGRFVICRYFLLNLHCLFILLTLFFLEKSFCSLIFRRFNYSSFFFNRLCTLYCTLNNSLPNTRSYRFHLWFLLQVLYSMVYIVVSDSFYFKCYVR